MTDHNEPENIPEYTKVNVSENQTPPSDHYVENESDAATERESQTLREALEKFKIELPENKVDLLDEYCDLLWTWNERLNLTRHATYDKFVARDLVDSMRVAALLQTNERVLDVGTGGGAPGLIAAILRPDVGIELSESTGKKAEALGAMVDALGLETNVWYAKAEDLLKERKFHTLTVRAVGKMRKLLLMFAPVWNRFDRLLMIKGPSWISERGEARHYNMFNTLALRKIDEYESPDEGFSSVVLQVCPKSKLEEIERRAKNLAKGLPFDGVIEESEIVERRQSATPRRSSYNVGGERHRDSRVATRPKRSEDNAERNTREPRSFFAARDRRNDSAQGGEERVFSRKNGKPPKGWTGKKSEFRAASDTVRRNAKTNGDPRNRKRNAAPKDKKRHSGD